MQYKAIDGADADPLDGVRSLGTPAARHGPASRRLHMLSLPTTPHHGHREGSYNFHSSMGQTGHSPDMLLPYSLKTSQIARAIATGRRNLAFYWHTHEMGGLVVLSVVALVVMTFGVLVYFSIVGHERSRDIHARNQALNCLARNIYHEARGEPIDGQYAVAEVTMNRVASKHYPNTVCEVVYQENFDVIRKRNVSAFSWTEIDVIAPVDRKLWMRTWKIAAQVYDEQAEPRAEGALFYHSKNIRPRWSRRKRHIAKIGGHVFY